VEASVAELHVRTLGGLELTLDGRPVIELASAKGRALVAYLAVTGEAASRSRLAGLLWSDLPEDAARANLRLALTKLRRALPDHVDAGRDAIRLTGRWTVDHPGELDGTNGEFLAGLDLADAALFDEWVAAERGMLRTAGLAALDERVGKALAGGDVDDGIAAARSILGKEPWSEAAHRALMELFARSGRPSAALAQFETCRHVLWDELGEYPSEETEGLADRIRRSSGIGLPGVGSGIQAGSPTSFVGRVRELGELERLLADSSHRIVSIVGPGGIGKTRIAFELARRLQAAGEQVTLAAFQGVPPSRGTEAEEVTISSLAAAAGVELLGERDPLELLVERLRDRRLLVIADNLEHLFGVEAVFESLVTGAPGIRLVVTSRRRVGLGAEWVYELGGLSAPPEGTSADLADFEAVRLFSERAEAAGAASVDLAEAAALCRAVDGLPLAIELAARQSRSVPLAELRTRLERGADVTDPMAGADHRHAGIGATLDWSWDLLGEPARAAFARLSVFPAGFTVPGAEAVADAGVDQLAELADHSLIRLEDGRYVVHELVRQYAARRLAGDPGIEQRTREAHARWAAAHLASGSLEPDVAADDLRAATGWMVEHAPAGELEPYLAGLVEVYRHRAWWAELRGIVETALARTDLPDLLRGEWLGVLAEAHREVGKAADAVEIAETALAVLGRPIPEGRLGQSALMAAGTALWALARSGVYRPGPARRRRAAVTADLLGPLGETYYVTETTERVKVVSWGLLVEGVLAGGPAYEAMSEVMRIAALTLAGRHARAAPHMDGVLAELRRGTMDPFRASYVAMSLSVFVMEIARWADVMEAAEIAVLAAEESARFRIGDQAAEIAALAECYRGEYEQGLERSRSLIEAARRRGSTTTQMWAHLCAAENALRAGRWDEAEILATEGARLADRAELRNDRVRARVVLGRVAARSGRLEPALEQAIAGRREMGTRVGAQPWAIEPAAGPGEIALDLIDVGFGDRHILDEVVDGSIGLTRRFTRLVPMAAPRLALLEGRAAVAAGEGTPGRRHLERSLAEAERFGMPWEAEQARHHLARIT
jgi:DNA-binding SARP family transcriptional activator/predicted ATPase